MKRLVVFLFILIMIVVLFYTPNQAANVKVKDLTEVTAPGDSTVFLVSWKDSGTWYSRVFTIEKLVDVFADSLQGLGLEVTTGTLGVNVDDATIEINSDNIRVKDSGISTAKILDGTLLTADHADSQISLQKMTTAAVNYIGAGGSVTNNPDDVTIENKGGSTLGIKHAGSSSTLYIAASTASAENRALADYECDGTDDQTDLSNAIAALPTSGGLIRLSEGTFEFDDGLTISKDSVTIEGTGSGTYINQDETIGITGDNITIRNIQFDNNGRIDEQFQVVDNNNIKFESCKFQNSGQHFISFAGVHNVWLDKIITTNPSDYGDGGMHGIDFDLGSRFNDNIFMSNCYLHNPGHDATKFENSRNIHITNCEFKAKVTLIDDPGEGPIESVLISNCNFKADTTSTILDGGLFLTTLDKGDISISNCIFDSTRIAVTFDTDNSSDTAGVTISNVIIKNNIQTSATEASLNIGGVGSVSINGLLINGSNSHGIYWVSNSTYSGKVSMSNVNIQNCALNGVNLDLNSYDFSGGTFENFGVRKCGAIGFSVNDAENLSFINIQVDSCDSRGMLINNCNDMIFNTITLRDNWQGTPTTNEGDLKIVNSYHIEISNIKSYGISNSNVNGIEMDNVDYTNINHGYIKKHQVGIRARRDCNHVTISNIVADSCLSFGLYSIVGSPVSSNVNWFNNVSRWNGDSGIVTTVPYSQVNGNYLFCNGLTQSNDAGIEVGSDSLFVTNNTVVDITGQSSFGIVVASGTGTIVSNNDVKQGGLTNIQDNGTNTVIRHNSGWVTEANGTATITNGSTSVVVTHGLSFTPSAGQVQVTPVETLNTASFFWVDTYTASNFTIKVNADPGQDVDFAWRASKE